MNKILGFVVVIAIICSIPVFALSDNINGIWESVEIIYDGIRATSNEISFYLRIDEGESVLIIDNTAYPVLLGLDEKGDNSLSIGDAEFGLVKSGNHLLSLVFNDHFTVVLKKTEEEPKALFSAINIESVLKQEDIESAEREAEAAALAAIKPASVFDMNVSFSEADTEKMSNYMLFGRYYLDDGTMFGMAYDKSGSLPSLVKAPISIVGTAPSQEAFTVLDRHVNANFLTRVGEKLYYIRIDRETGMSSLAYINLKTEKVIELGSEMHEMAYLQIRDGRIWYTGEEHRLYSCKMNGSDNKLELDKIVYDPYFLTDDWLIYQDEEDGETLHLRCIGDGTDIKITETRSFNPIVNGTALYFTSIPDAGGQAYLSRIDLSCPLKEGDFCFAIESSKLSMSKSFYIFESTIYGENNSSVMIDNWKELTNSAWLTVTQRFFYIGDPFIIYGEMYSEHATVSQLYLLNRNTGERALFRHVY